MIEYDHSTLCAHVKALCSGRISDRSIKAFVGFLCKDPNSVEPIAKDIATVFTHALSGDFDVPRERIPRIGVSGQHVYHDQVGVRKLGNRYKSDFLNECLELPYGEDTVKIWAGLTNLKSCLIKRGLSRTDRDATRERIIHEVDIEEGFLLKWQKFLSRFLPVLTNTVGPMPERRYDPIWSIPQADKAACTYQLGHGLVKTRIGTDKYCDLNEQLCHPIINRIAREYPNEFAQATILGYDAELESFQIPAVPATAPEEPIGYIAVSPKVAEKPRVIFITLAALNSLSRPLFYVFDHLERTWNIQFVHNQDGARELLRQCLIERRNLQSNEVIDSYDQSAFTDNFSYKYIQRPVVEELIRLNWATEFDLAVLDYINYGLWDAKVLKSEPIRFGTGTGMGTPPSFPLASITNGLLATYAYVEEYGEYPSLRTKEPFCTVVGDDMAITDHKVAVRYEQICSVIGLQLNADKTISSHLCAEFCGKMITPEGIFDKHKLKPNSTLGGIRHSIAYYGSDAEDFFRYLDTDYSDTIQTLQGISTPYGSLDPSEVTDEFQSNLIKAYQRSHELGDTDYRRYPLQNGLWAVSEGALREADLRLILRRKALLPVYKVKEEQMPSLSPAGIVPRNPLIESLARTVHECHSRLLRTSDRGEICDLTTLINQSYEMIVKLDPRRHYVDRRSRFSLIAKSDRARDPVRQIAHQLSRFDAPY